MGFPKTRHSVLERVRAATPEAARDALSDLMEVYWRPVYTYLRLRWRLAPSDAEDATQEFFARALDKGWLAQYRPEKGRFRTYLRTCLDGFAAKAHKAAGRLKRGGGVELVGMDFPSAEGELVARELPVEADQEALFHREWVRAVLAQAVEDLECWCEAEGKPQVFIVFQRYDLEGPPPGEKLTYADLGRELGLPTTQVTNFLHLARTTLRALLVERVRRVSASDDEALAEVRAVLEG
jgi:RNA polymerase sigma factor (sigma-70 family)